MLLLIMAKHKKRMHEKMRQAQGKASLESRMQELIRLGIVAWNGHKLKFFKPHVRTRGNKTVTELLLEDRE